MAVVELEGLPVGHRHRHRRRGRSVLPRRPPPGPARVGLAVGRRSWRRPAGRWPGTTRRPPRRGCSGAGSGMAWPRATTKRRLASRSGHPVLRTGRPGQRRLDRRQVELERLGEDRLGRRVEPQALLLGVGLDQGDHLGRAAGEAQVAQRLVVDGEDRDGRAVLRRHVADRGPVLDRHVGHARAVELDELADHAVLAEPLGDGQDEVGGGRPLGQLAGEAEADHRRDEHRDRLAEHGRLGLDAADAPADHAEPVDHRGVGVGADQGVGEGHAVAGGDDGGQVLEVDLVADARSPAGRPGASRTPAGPSAGTGSAPGCARTPAAALRAKASAMPKYVDRDRVVDDEVDGDARLEARRVAARARRRRRAWRPGRRWPGRR